MANPRLLIRCPRSALSWTATVRRAGTGAPRFTASCPSCGTGLVLTYGPGAVLVITPRSPLQAAHTIVQREPLRLPLAPAGPGP